MMVVSGCVYVLVNVDLMVGVDVVVNGMVW